MKKSVYVRYENQYDRNSQRRRRKRNYAWAYLLTAVASILILTLIGYGVYYLVAGNKSAIVAQSSASGSEGSETQASIALGSPTAAPSNVRQAYQNFQLFPGAVKLDVGPAQAGAGLSAAERKVTQTIFAGGQEVASYSRPDPINMGDPLNFQSVPGILTFRGNNFRNAAAWGTVDVKEGTMEQVWEFNGIGTLPSSAWNFSWAGTGWTGQPLSVQWSPELQAQMNLLPEKKAKADLVEVLVATMDGNVYFFDIEDGQKSRPPINVGATIKGTPSLDPRGYPLLYVGQGDNNSPDKQMGFRIYSLITGELLYFQDTNDTRSHRSNWYACDSSPMIDPATDTLFYPVENGIIYTMKLNTQFDKATGALSINPDKVDYRYLAEGVIPENVGVESSLSIYSHYAYFCDNAGNLVCLDLNTMNMVWNRALDDDSDVTPVLEEENGRVYLYVGTEVDWQKSELDYQGQAFTYKIDAMNGEIVWKTSQLCYTHNGVDKGDDVNGGMLGNPVVGKKSISNLVIFAYSMTDGMYSGNLVVAYKKDSGEMQWKYHMNKYSWSSPVDVYDENGNAYIVMCDSFGQIHLINGQTGERVTYFQTIRNKGLPGEVNANINIESSPMVFNNMIVIGNRAGSIVGVKIK